MDEVKKFANFGKNVWMEIREKPDWLLRTWDGRKNMVFVGKKLGLTNYDRPTTLRFAAFGEYVWRNLIKNYNPEKMGETDKIILRLARKNKLKIKGGRNGQ